VLLKLAISADGKAGAPGGLPVAITGEEVRERVHLLRAENDAIMIGIGTALADDPQLTCRLPGMAKRSPIRVIADSALRLPLESQLVRSAGDTPVWVVCGSNAPKQAESGLQARGAAVLRLAKAGDPLDLGDVLGLLSAKGITRLMVEGGPALAGAFITADLVDEAVLFQAPMVVGPDGVDALALEAEAALLTRLKKVSSEPVGGDQQEVYLRG
jgi:diaminohydroxyphosphoribosylaminopyrimidine deaminase/5-amino-6-(5-phosphoribosylamino)uracil reductase